MKSIFAFAALSLTALSASATPIFYCELGAPQNALSITFPMAPDQAHLQFLQLDNKIDENWQIDSSRTQLRLNDLGNAKITLVNGDNEFNLFVVSNAGADKYMTVFQINQKGAQLFSGEAECKRLSVGDD